MTTGSSPRGIVWAAEDSPLQRDAVRQALAPAFHVEAFDDGAGLLERLASSEVTPDVIVVDWNMPIVSGLAVCEYVRERFDATALPLLVLTATTDPNDLLLGLDVGANDFVAKPFNAAELTARVRGLVRFKRLGDALRSEAEFRERMMGILGHDLRQPLNTFSLGAAALVRADLPPGPAQTARRLLAVAARMNRMVTDLLDVTRSRQGGGLPIQRRLMDLREVCEQAVSEYRMAQPDRAISLEISGDTSGYWDPDRLTQVCTNLLGNALEHGEAGRPIQVIVAAHADGVLLCVENEGEGISESLRPMLFQPFRRGRKSSKTGLGLGLFIVDQIARAHEGTTTVLSDDNVTSFLVHLPRGAPPESLDSSASLEGRAGATG